MALGVLLGPSVLGIIDNVEPMAEMSSIGIVFLLFLLGLDMQPKALISVLRKATFVGLISCALFLGHGAEFHLDMVPEIALPALVMAIAVLIIKPVVFRHLLGQQSERTILAWDIGFRLGQISEFSLLIAYLAMSQQLIGSAASHLIQATAILTFLVSSYIVVLNFPNPIAIKDHLRRD